MSPGCQLGPISAFAVDQQGCKELFPTSALVQDHCSSPLSRLSMTSLETFMSVVAMTQLGRALASSTGTSQSHVWLCRQARGLQVEQGSASWWGMGFLWSLAQVQIEFIFLFQLPSLTPPQPLKEERQVSVI